MPEQFTLKEQRIVVRYMKANNTPNDDIYKLLSTAAGPTCASYKEVKQWAHDIDEGKEDTDICTCFLVQTDGNLERLGTTDPALVCRIENLINNDRRLSLDRAVELTAMNEFFVNQVITSVLTVRRVYERWIPRGWTPDQRNYRVNVCKVLMDMYNYGDEDFLPHLIVGDECFGCYYSEDANSRRPSQADGFLAPGGRRSSKAEGMGSRRTSRVDGLGFVGEKYRPLREPVLANSIMFYDMKGILVHELMPEGQSADPEFYATMLKETLMPVLKRKRNYSPDQPIYLLHDNTFLHESLHFQKIQKELNIKKIPQPPNSPDMEPHEFWLFRQLKKLTVNAVFKSRADIDATLTKHILSFTEADFANSIAQLPRRWERIIENDGMYILN